MKDHQPSTVSLIACDNYERKRIESAVRRAVDLQGGIRAFVRPGQRVLLKPNLLKPSLPEQAVTTHPEVVRSVIRLVKEAGGTPLVGDSPGFGELRRVCEQAGIMTVIEEEGAQLCELDQAVTVRNAGRFHYFEIARAIYESDVVINLPKFKTHGMMTLTGAVKNLFGCIPGRRKVQWHFNAGVNQSAFARMLVELCALINPALTVMDAVVGMEGNGPGSGDPRKIGIILAGRDPVAIDVVSARLVGADPSLLSIVRAAAEAGTGETRLAQIKLLGDALENRVIKDFVLPTQSHLEWPIPEWARRLAKNALTTRPVIDQEICVKCGICREHCPQHAILLSETKLVIQYRDCIRCFCCQEFCPQGAITVGKGWGLKLLP